MTNRQRIQKEINKKGSNFKIGCWDKQVELLNYNNLKKVINNIGENTDVEIHINRKKYICQLTNIDNEIDFNIISRTDYMDQYGDIYEEE